MPLLAAVRQADTGRKASEVLREQLEQRAGMRRNRREQATRAATGAQIDRDYILAVSNIIVKWRPRCNAPTDSGYSTAMSNPRTS